MAIETSSLGPQFPAIKGVDTEKGIIRTGGTIDGYRQVLSMFCKDIKERLQLLRFFFFESLSGNKFPIKHIPSFTTQVHAIKSAAASLGAEEISAEAGRLEEAGLAKDLIVIYENLSPFIEHLSELADNIRVALNHFLEDFKQEATEPEAMEAGIYVSRLKELIEVLKSQNVMKIDRILDELNKIPLDSRAKKMLEQVSDQILMTEFASAIKTLDEFVANNNG